jgi:phosphoribosyl 1,2-cyclic phosphodiesterase
MSGSRPPRASLENETPAEVPPAGLRFRVLGSGSKGNATLVEGGGSRVLLDAGLGPRILSERLGEAGVEPCSLDAIVLSHEHSDHAAGAWRFSARHGVPILACRSIHGSLVQDKVRAPSPLPLGTGSTHVIGSLTITTFRVHHDARDPLGFVVSHEGATLGHATDLGLLTGAVTGALAPCGAVLLESNYDPILLREGPYPWSLKERILSDLGHLGNGDVAAFLEHGGMPACRTLVLAHLSENNNHPELALGAASAGLARGGRRGVEVEIADARGTGWISVPKAPSAARPGQARLF